MKEKGLFSLNLLLIVGITCFLAVLQTSFHPLKNIGILALLPNSINWVPALVFLSISRKPKEAIISIYFLTFFLTPFTVVSLGVLLLLSLTVFITSQSFKSQLFWSGPSYFIIVSAISTFSFFVAEFFLSLLLNTHSGYWPPLLTWIAQIILSIIPSYLLFYVFTFIDTITHKEPLTENSGK